MLFSLHVITKKCALNTNARIKHNEGAGTKYQISGQIALNASKWFSTSPYWFILTFYLVSHFGIFAEREFPVAVVHGNSMSNYHCTAIK